MKKFIIIFTVLLILPSLAFAQFSISLTKNEITVFAGKVEEIYLKIKNEGFEKRTFSLMIWPERFDKVAVLLEKYLVEVLGGEEKEVKITISATKDAREITGLVKIVVKERETGEIKEDLFAVRVKREFAPVLEEVKTDKESYKMGESLKSYVLIKNLGTASEDVQIVFKILRAGKPIYKEVREITLHGGEEKRIEFSFQILQEHLPGKYEIEVEMFKAGKLISSISKSFGIESTIEYEIKKVKSISLLGSKIDIIVTNKGNDVATIGVRERLPYFLKPFLKFEIEPNSTIEEKEGITFVWLVTIEPGEKAMVSYQIILFPVILIIAFMVAFVYFSYLRAFSPLITKSTSYVGPLTPKNEITISIELSNKSMHTIKRVTIKDFVPGIIQVIPKFDTLPPKIKRTEEGTILTWKISSLKKGEERVLTYRVRPTLKIIGSIKLPPAELSYQIGKVKQKRKSGSIMVGE